MRVFVVQPEREPLPKRWEQILWEVQRDGWGWGAEQRVNYYRCRTKKFEIEAELLAEISSKVISTNARASKACKALILELEREPQ